jgi:hypothetical protein
MIFKSLRFLLLSVLLCSAIFVIAVATIQNENQIATETCGINYAKSTRSGLILVGDPVPGGGTPLSGNWTWNGTC